MNKNLVPSESIISKIMFMRNQKVLLDSDIAGLYGVETKVLVQAVKRNIKRFPIDFMFQLTKEEFSFLRSQFVTSKRGGRRYSPYVFTEQGVAMLSSIINSERAIEVNILIMRTFVKLRELVSTHKNIAKKFKDLEDKHKTHDAQLKKVIEVINHLLLPQPKQKRKIGYIIDD